MRAYPFQGLSYLIERGDRMHLIPICPNSRLEKPSATLARMGGGEYQDD